MQEEYKRREQEGDVEIGGLDIKNMDEATTGDENADGAETLEQPIDAMEGVMASITTSSNDVVDGAGTDDASSTTSGSSTALNAVAATTSLPAQSVREAQTA